MKPWFSQKKDMQLEIERLKRSQEILIERIRYLEDKCEKVKDIFFDELNPYEE